MDLLISLIVGYVLGHVVMAAIEAWRMYKSLSSESGAIQTEAQGIQTELESGNLIPLTVEVAEVGYLCYNSITNDFVCQGRNLDEIVDHFKSRYPDKNASIHRGDSEAMASLKAQLKAKHENSNSV
jgi:hypothetical protein